MGIYQKLLDALAGGNKHKGEVLWVDLEVRIVGFFIALAFLILLNAFGSEIFLWALIIFVLICAVWAIVWLMR